MNRILVITWFYPPVNSSEGIVTYKLLNNSKYKYDVFTQKNSSSWSYGNKDYLENNGNIECIYAKSDNLRDWKKEAINYFKNNKEKYDIVMTRSMPPESHEIGVKIKKIKPSIKLIASFGDPISNNPYTLINSANPYKINAGDSKVIILNPIRMAKSFLYKIKRRIMRLGTNIEKKTIDNADLLIFNSIEQKDYMLKGNEKNSIVLAHSYYEKLYPKVSNKKNDKITMAYIGHLDEIRTPRLLLQAVNELKNENNDLKDKLKIEFYGNMAKVDKTFILDNELSDIVKYKKQIGYVESLKTMKEVDFLLHIDANLGGVIDKNIFFAAKLADYIGSRTPIIGITMLDGVSADILRDINGLVLTYSTSDIKNYLRKIIYEDYAFKLDDNACKKYSATVVAKEFDKRIEKLMKK